MPSSGSGSASGPAPQVGTPSGTSLSISEIVETTGIDPALFNIEASDDFDAIIERQLPFARADVRRLVGPGIFNSDDADRSLQVKSAILYQIGARVMLSALTQRVTGTGAPLLMANPADIRSQIRHLTEAAKEAADAAVLEGPTSPETLQESASFTGTRDASFTGTQDTRY